MIINNLKIFLQNICKNHLLTNILLENQKDFDILFIQELLQLVIRMIPSAIFAKEEEIVSTPNHLSQNIFVRQSNNNNDKYPRVIIYISLKLNLLQFLLRKNIYNHRNINLIYFINQDSIYFILNVYSDNYYSALKYLKDIEVFLNDILIMIGDFNIRDSDWDSFFLHHLVHTDTLLEIADFFDLKQSISVNQVSTKYVGNPNELNFVINLMF